MSREEQLSTVLDFLLEKLVSERSIRDGLEYELGCSRLAGKATQEALADVSGKFSLLWKRFHDLMAQHQPDVEIGEGDKDEVIIRHFYRLISANAALSVAYRQSEEKAISMAQDLHVALGLSQSVKPFDGKEDLASWWKYLIEQIEDVEDEDEDLDEVQRVRKQRLR